VVIVLWLPIAGFLALLFQPEMELSPLGMATFALAIWGAYLIRTVLYWTLGMVTFWTTRVGPIFELVFTVELLLSGRLVPLALLPEWARGVADVLPFKWTFGFPIEALIGRLSDAELLGGLAMQVAWIVIGSVVLRLVWRSAIRRYSAVGN
jgi:ABC-2 type transport system permease protein